MNATGVAGSFSPLEMVLFGIAGVWLLLAVVMLGLMARAREESGLTNSMKLFIGATATLVIVVAVVIWSSGEERVDAAEQAANASSGERTCASISAGMKADEVRTMLGEPGEIQNAEDMRGPGSERWVYGGSRCRIHLLDGVVTYVE